MYDKIDTINVSSAVQWDVVRYKMDTITVSNGTRCLRTRARAWVGFENKKVSYTLVYLYKLACVCALEIITSTPTYKTT